METKPLISYEDFSKLDLRIGTVLEVELVADSSKLLKLLVSIGEEKRQIIAGIQKSYAPESLIGRQILLIVNLEPRKLAGLESQGMILAAHAEDGSPILLFPEKAAPNGSTVS